MKVIPVLDILNGKVVHAIKGKRSDYQPIKSSFTSSAEPLEVARAFRNTGFRDLYIADLDAIIDCSTNFQVLKQIIDSTGLKLMVDAGITNLDRAQKLLASGVSKLIVGTETLTEKSFVSKAIQLFGKDRVVVSIDLKDGKVLVKPGFDGCTEALGLLREFVEMGVSNFIILDLTKVGSSEGINSDLLKQIHETLKLEIYVGGGARNIKDLIDLKNLGVSGVLVATALHNGKITVQQLKAEGFL
jgi:phosphoribosylformimino-5-aminoimidazole carboxamide ribotide isomerase